MADFLPRPSVTLALLCTVDSHTRHTIWSVMRAMGARGLAWILLASLMILGIVATPKGAGGRLREIPFAKVKFKTAAMVRLWLLQRVCLPTDGQTRDGSLTCSRLLRFPTAWWCVTACHLLRHPTGRPQRGVPCSSDRCHSQQEPRRLRVLQVRYLLSSQSSAGRRVQAARGGVYIFQDHR